ncbi:PREDICTED: hyaluronan mediated motility receptor-like [Polistes dominula]|uniref:Hyaluronan mediated motility receptor-like n=1 Tax=Polistes dominula TaxID=743375 RepID=A0ABM1JHA2_POLDO|nr:PREDICTED: hyaluronan mediated motility receptor-like [Polistes dominula]
MSFAKARIQRFNDLTNKVPPPGAYDPKFGPKVKGLAIEKRERFQDNKSVTSNSTESSLTVSRNSARKQLPEKFVAPICVKKRVIVKPMSTSLTKEKLKSTNQINSKSVNKQQYNSTHELLELKVECENKDRTIHEHEKQIEEMKEEICKLEVQIEELHRKQIEVEEQHKKDIETMAKLQQEVLDNHDERHQAEANELRTKLLDISREKEEEISARRTVEKELRNRVAELSERILHLESEFAKKTEANQALMTTLEIRNEELLSKLKALEEERNIQIDLLEKEKLQLTLDVNDLTENKCELEAKLEKRQNVILELQGQLSTLQCELDELRAEYDKLVYDSTMETNQLVKEHNKEKETSIDWFLKENQKLEQEHEQTKMTVVKLETDLEKVTETNTCLQNELQDMKRLYTDVNQQLTQAHKELESAEEKHELLLEKHETEIEALKKKHHEENLQLQHRLEEIRINYINGIENLCLAKFKETVDIKNKGQHIEEENNQIKEIEDIIEGYLDYLLPFDNVIQMGKIRAISYDHDGKVNIVCKEATSEVEGEMSHINNIFMRRLTVLESERAALKSKLALKDEEIEALSFQIKELKYSAATQESFSQSLQIELDKAETELIEKKAELKALKNQIRSEAAELVSRRKRFEIIMTENKAAFAAVSEHLAQSNAEVERLQYELKCAEDNIKDYQDFLISIYNNTKVVQNYTKQLDANRQIVNQIEADSISQCETLKKRYENKIDELKQVASLEITRLCEAVKKKSSQCAEMKKQLDEMAGSLWSSQNLLVNLEQTNDEHLIKISRLELENIKLKEILQKQEGKLSATCNPIDEEAYHQSLEQSQKEKLEENDRCEDNKCLLIEKKTEESYEEKLINDLAAERVLRENIETKYKILTESNDLLKKVYDETYDKYVQARISRHSYRRNLVLLKETIHRLEQELESKNKQLEQLQQNITTEKVKLQQKRSQTKGKENVIGGGISKSNHTTPTSSPHKSLTPLRDRNE